MTQRSLLRELDLWLDNSNDTTTPIDRITVEAARDEIVALRRDWLEVCQAIAIAIRALR